LLTYGDARSRAKQIAEVTRTRFMPPWLPEPGHEAFANERRLNDSEVEILARWAGSGAPEGDASVLPAAPKFTKGWQLGEPDFVIESPAFTLPAGGPDRFRNFVLTVPEFNGTGSASRWVRAVELRPVNARVTHHARMGIDSDGESWRRDQADPAPGYEGMAWGKDPPGQLMTWTPGMTADVGESGVAWRLESGSRLVLHTHLQPSGKDEEVRFRVGFYFVDAAPTVHPQMLRIGSRDIDIPADATEHTVRDVYELPIDADVNYVFPHAHKLCRTIRLEAQLPDGSTRTLIAIPRFDENWHDKYVFAKPVRLPEGTRLVTTFTYDNSAGNTRNPHRPPRRVVYGSNADDEMEDMYLQVTPVDASERAVLREHEEQAELASKIVGYRKALEMYPEDEWDLEGLASCYVAAKTPAKAVELLNAHPKLLESSAQAMIILGMAELAAGKTNDAEASLREALKRDDEAPLSWLGLGQALTAEKRADEAMEATRRAVELAPGLIAARLDLVDLLIADDKLDGAIAVCQEACGADPENHLPLVKLANLLARQGRYKASLATFAKARELAPFLYSPQASLAIACYQLGDEAEASKLLAEAAMRDADDPVPRFFLGQIARRDEAWAAAKENLAGALALPAPRSWPATK
jgi:tetratricopeptide (TPR) repeat protein